MTTLGHQANHVLPGTRLLRKGYRGNSIYYLIVKFYMFYKVFFIFNYFGGFGFLVFYYMATFDLYCDWSKQSHEYLLPIRNLV
jgi:hypothetical protein